MTQTPTKPMLLRSLALGSCALLLGACAQPSPPPAGALAPPAERISDRAIHADLKAFEAMQARVQALNDRGRANDGPAVADYHLAKAQCWLDVSFHEYTRNDRSSFPQVALGQAQRLIGALEARGMPPEGTPLVNDAARLRPDLWAEAAALRMHRGWRCAAPQAACAEVELVHAGHEYRQLGWRHAVPYIRLAEQQIAQARAAAEGCEGSPAAERR